MGAVIAAGADVNGKTESRDVHTNGKAPLHAAGAVQLRRERVRAGEVKEDPSGNCDCMGLILPAARRRGAVRRRRRRCADW